MAFDDVLADRIRRYLAGREDIAEKRMFGGIGFLLDGNILVGVWKDSLVVRVGPDGYEDALLGPHVSEFDITGRAMNGWVLVGPAGVEEDERLVGWIRIALKFVGTLPPKRPDIESKPSPRTRPRP